MNGVLLSSSFDWSVKLWCPKVTREPIFSFESNEDYILDTKWNPMNPCFFATGDGEGYLDLWDIGSDLEAPIVRTHTGKSAVNKLRWSLDGSKLYTGHANGEIQVHSTNKKALEFKGDKFAALESKIKSKSYHPKSK